MIARNERGFEGRKQVKTRTNKWHKQVIKQEIIRETKDETGKGYRPNIQIPYQ